MWKYISNDSNYNPCELVSSIFHSSTPNYSYLQCWDVAKVRFSNVVVNYVDARGQDYSFYPTLRKDSYVITYNVFNHSFSGVISNVAEGRGNALINGNNAIYYDINSNTWTGLIPNILQGYGNNSFGNLKGTIYTDILCPPGASRHGNRCYYNFNKL